MNNKGWIRIVEAFVSILLIIGALLIMINSGYIYKEDISNKVYNTQISILREIELNEQFRTDILSIDQINLPVKWENFKDDENFNLQNVRDHIVSRIPNYLTCIAKICNLEELCVMEDFVNRDIYAQPIAIAATPELYNPRQLKLFCWTF